jgi:hypothetical protein
MEKIIFLGIVVTFLFCIVKFLEMKYLEKTMRPLKEFVRDAAIVFSCAISGGLLVNTTGNYLTELMNVVTETKTLDAASTQIFTDLPGF